MAGKAKFDQEAAFKSIIGAGATEDEKKADKPAGKGRPPVERETKKRVSLALYPSSYGALQKIAYVNRQSASDIVSELISYVYYAIYITCIIAITCKVRCGDEYGNKGNKDNRRVQACS